MKYAQYNAIWKSNSQNKNALVTIMTSSYKENITLLYFIIDISIN